MTDGHIAYLTAVEDALGAEINYAMLQEIYGTTNESPETRYSSAVCMGARKAIISGSPDHNRVSTSYAERQKFNHAHVDAPLHSPNKWILKEALKTTSTRWRSISRITILAESFRNINDGKLGTVMSPPCLIPISPFVVKYGTLFYFQTDHYQTQPCVSCAFPKSTIRLRNVS